MSERSSSKQLVKNSTIDQIFRFYWISIIGIVLYIVLDVIAQLLPPHYSPIRDAESDLAVGPYGFIMTINFVNRGILSLSFIYAFLKTLDLTGGKRTPFRSGYYFLGIWAVGALLLAIFPTDVPATPISWHGAIHLVVALVAFIGGAMGVLVLSRHFAENVSTKGAKRIAVALGWLSVLLLVVQLGFQFILPRLSARFFGLTERLFLASVLLWILTISIYMVTHKQSIEAELKSESEYKSN
ncbi:MAG: DUF998 domain-containing protein [Nitrososphaerota archaeon]|nr:DUF998 domain-containing protein [Nitrososphaerota archaeon]